MESFDKIKGGAIAIFTLIASYFGALAIPFALLVICNVVDYITGMMAAGKRLQKIDSEKGYAGIQKKIGMWLVVVVAAVVDFGLGYAAAQIGITIPISYVVACLVSIWLLFNELISILENLKDVGVKLPPFLLPIIENIKSQTESKAGVKSEPDDENAEDKNLL